METPSIIMPAVYLTFLCRVPQLYRSAETGARRSALPEHPFGFEHTGVCPLYVHDPHLPALQFGSVCVHLTCKRSVTQGGATSACAYG